MQSWSLSAIAMAAMFLPTMQAMRVPDGSLCPSVDSFQLSSPFYQRSFQLREYLGEGVENCAYITVDDKVAKADKLQPNDKLYNQREERQKSHREALITIGVADGVLKLYDYGKDDQGRYWVVETRELGMPIYKTEYWKGQLGGGEFLGAEHQVRGSSMAVKCQQTMMAAYSSIADATVRHYLRKYGLFSNDISPDNVLFVDPGQATGAIIDWGTVTQVNKDKLTKEGEDAFVTSAIDRLKERFPINDDVLFPGICWSRAAQSVNSGKWEDLKRAYRRIQREKEEALRKDAEMLKDISKWSNYRPSGGNTKGPGYRYPVRLRSYE